jgi:hypothetical protein
MKGKTRGAVGKSSKRLESSVGPFTGHRKGQELKMRDDPRVEEQQTISRRKDRYLGQFQTQTHLMLDRVVESRLANRDHASHQLHRFLVSDEHVITTKGEYF